jgi:hypothetical protein
MSAFNAGAQQPAEPPQPLRGHVRSVDGQPLAGAEVNVDDARSNVRSDAGGAFTIENLPRGIHSIRVKRIGYLPAAIEMVTRGVNDTLTLTLVASRQELDTVKVRARSNVLAGIVVDAYDKPIPGAEVNILGDRLLGSTDSTGADGWFRFSGVRSGPIIVRVMKDGYMGATASIDLSDWRGIVIHMDQIDSTLSSWRQKLLSGFANTERHVMLETRQRLAARNVQSIIVTREELAPLGDLPLGEAITHARSAVNLLRDMQVSRNVACVLLNGRQLVGQVSLDTYDTEDVEFVELYPPYMPVPASVRAYLTIAGCKSAGSALMDSRGILYAVVWLRN